MAEKITDFENCLCLLDANAMLPLSRFCVYVEEEKKKRVFYQANLKADDFVYIEQLVCLFFNIKLAYFHLNLTIWNAS
jgi:hypothetical protein